MKKIAFYIDNTSRGGAQRVMCNLVEFFANQGYDVLFINDFKLDTEKPQYHISNGIKRVYLQETLNAGHFRINALRRLLKEEKPEVIVSFLRRPNIRMLIASVGLKMKKYVSVRNDPKREYGSSIIWKFAVNMLFMLATGCVFQTGDAQKYFWKAIRRKSKIIYNPVDQSFFDVKREKKTHDIVTFGRLAPQKNHSMLIKAFALIAEKYPDEELYIYGEGNSREELLNLTKELGIAARVHFPGNVSNIPEILSYAKLFVLSSDYEGMPNALMEAMAAGVPSISTDCPCGGPKELFGEELAAYLVECNNYVEFADAICMVLKNGQVLNEISMKTKMVAAMFSSDTVFCQWEEYIACR